MARPFSLSLNPPLSSFHRNRHSRFSGPSPFTVSSPSPHLQLHKNSSQYRGPVVSASPDTPNHSLEESRWLREEQRWLREEQRWLREERRWARERESLLAEIAQLRLQLQALQRQGPIEVLKEKNLITQSGSIGGHMVLGEGKGEEEEVEEQIVVEEKVIRVVDEVKKQDERKNSSRTLRVGAEGDEVKAMQEALQKLGFYSGEEDMEYSSFSSGTERAVKTWQASIGVKEDGIMTTELLEILYSGQLQDSNSFTKSDKTGGANGAPVPSVDEMSKYEQTVTEESDMDHEASPHRVFLLGENRWEEPSRLMGRDMQNVKTKSGKSTTKCLGCRGEGRLMCTECDGTGEPNIEPQYLLAKSGGISCCRKLETVFLDPDSGKFWQKTFIACLSGFPENGKLKPFLEWVDEGMKCPYCEGLGYTICDVCEGKAVV